jgi:two-component system, NtrC family, nitrogen regulation sensor histidine kinase NtrY
MIKQTREQRKTIIGLMAVVAVLLILATILQTVNVASYLESPESQTTIILWALSSLNVVFLTIFSLILLRSLIKLYTERRSQEPGSKFKTKLVFSFLGMTFIPILFMSFFAVFMLNRNIDKWFSAPIDRMLANLDQQVALRRQEAQQSVVDEAQVLGLSLSKQRWVPGGGGEEERQALQSLIHSIQPLFAAVLDSVGRPLLVYDGVQLVDLQNQLLLNTQFQKGILLWGKGRVAAGEKGLKNWRSPPRYNFLHSNLSVEEEEVFLLAGPLPPPLPLGYSLLLAERIPEDVRRLGMEMAQSRKYYQGLASHRKFIRNNYLLWMGLITLLILFAAVWIGLYFSKRITVPIKALAEAAEQVSRGNLQFQIDCPAEDELGSLIAIFNRMTVQLHENAQQLEQANQDLQNSNRALEEKSRYMETVMESIPTGVISIAVDYSITKMNRAAQRLLGHQFKNELQLQHLFAPPDLEEIFALLKKGARLGYASREMPLHSRERTFFAAITISSLDDSAELTSALGFVMVLEDLTEVMKAQKSSAWREVARRMAHEIKNPLTPIQLSAERLLRNYRLLQQDPLREAMERRESFGKVVEESAQTVTREVETLKRMVDEFSRFARMPSANLTYCNVNTIIENTLTVYHVRFEGVVISKNLAPGLPEIQLDAEQFNRLFVNLFDNALEAMEQSPVRELKISTEYLPQKETIQIQVCDTGHGIDPADREKLFLPYFSTRKRGTGLGLAIVSRIVSDHKGYIHIEEHQPEGTCFIIEIPTRA